MAQFEATIGPSLTHPAVTLSGEAVAALGQAVQLYTGELLVGLYDDWALRERERLKSLYMDCLTHLLQYYRHHGQGETSLAYGRQILAQEPWREEVHRILMQLYLEQGQRAEAIHQYETCQQILRTELDVAPMAETQALYAQALAQASPGAVSPEELTRALAQLRVAQQMLTTAQTQLTEALDLVLRLVQQREGG